MQTSENKLDPRSKLVIVLCLSTLGIAIENLYMLAGVMILSLAVSKALGCRLGHIINKLKKILWLFVTIALIQSLFSPSGNVLLSVGLVPVVTGGGLYKGGVMVVRMAIIIISAAIMTTSNSREMVQGFVQWKVPYEIAFMVSVAIRFLPILSEEINDTLTSIQLRGVELKKIPLKKRLRVYSYILMPIVVSTIIKSQDLSTAMEMRAFRAYPNRTSYMVLKMDRNDYTVITISLLLSAFIIGLYHISLRGGGIL